MDLKEWDRAVADLEEANNLDAADHAALWQMGRAYRAKRNPGTAIVVLGQAIQLDDTVPSYYNERGQAFMDRNECDRAIADFKQALHLESGNISALLNLAVVYRKQGHLDRSLHYASEAVRLHCDDAAAYAERSFSHGACGNWAEAIADLEEMLKLKPDDRSNRLWVLNRQAFLERERGNPQAALAILRDAAKINPTDFASYAERTHTFRARGLGQGDGGRQYVRQARSEPLPRLCPPRRGVRGQARSGAIRRGLQQRDRPLFGAGQSPPRAIGAVPALQQWGKALADLDRSVELDPQNPWVYEARAALRDQKGDGPGAEEDRKAAARLRSKTPGPLSP